KKIHYIKYRIEKETLLIKEVKKHGEDFDLKTDLPNIFDEDECCYVVIDVVDFFVLFHVIVSFDYLVSNDYSRGRHDGEVKYSDTISKWMRDSNQ
uniref:hypothetical protein n=1 Tax=Salmonella sp. s54395 TaxID=3159664 RepID=UPI003980136D